MNRLMSEIPLRIPTRVAGPAGRIEAGWSLPAGELLLIASDLNELVSIRFARAIFQEEDGDETKRRGHCRHDGPNR